MASSRRKTTQEANEARREQRALLASVLRGDRAAGAALFERHAMDVRRFLRFAVGPHREAEDMLQEVFVNVFRDLRSLREPDALRAFIISIAANVARNQLRRDKIRRLVGLTPSGDLPEMQAATGSPLAATALTRLHAILSGLSATDRTLFILRYYEDMSLVEVGEALHLSLATVKRRLRRTTARLARQVRGDYVLAGFLDLDRELPL